MTVMKAAFLGLGVMGFPMAGHAAKAGVDLRVYNRSMEKSPTLASDLFRLRCRERRGRGGGSRRRRNLFGRRR